MAMRAASALKTKSTEIRAALKSPKKTKSGKSDSDPTAEEPVKGRKEPKSTSTMDPSHWAGSKGEAIPVCVKCEEEGGTQCQGPCMLFYHEECSGVKTADSTDRYIIMSKRHLIPLMWIKVLFSMPYSKLKIY